MAEAISDAQLVAVLRTYVRACAPVIDALRESDPFRLKAYGRGGEQPARRGFRTRVLGAITSIRVPGTAAWAAMDTAQRIQWWTGRFGRVTALVTAIPGLGGALADRLPVQDILGVASQGLVLCAIAGECGVTDVGTRVRLIASVVFGRDVDPALAAGVADGQALATENADVAQLTENLDESKRKHGAVTLRAIGSTLWRLGRSLRGISAELGKRPSGRFYHHLLGQIPVVGAAGDYFGERSGMRRVRRRAMRWLMTYNLRPAAVHN